MTDPHRPVTTTDVHPVSPPAPAVRAELERLGELSQAIAAAAAQIDAQRRTIERLLAAATSEPPPAPAPVPRPSAPLAPAPAPAHPGALRGPIRARRRAHPAHMTERAPTEARRVPEPVPTRAQAQTEASPDSEAALATARLVALSMAASGSSRSEVARHLRSERGIRDTARVTDHVFGRPERA
jgi:hypothetical protein